MAAANECLHKNILPIDTTSPRDPRAQLSGGEESAIAHLAPPANAQDAEQDEERTTPATCTDVGTAGNRDDAVVLCEDGERRHREQCRQETADTIALCIRR